MKHGEYGNLGTPLEGSNLWYVVSMPSINVLLCKH